MFGANYFGRNYLGDSYTVYAALLTGLVADNLDVTDSISFALTKSLSDSTSVADSLAHVADFVRTVADNMTVTDALAKAVVKLNGDTISLSDAVVRAVGLSHDDGLTAVADIIGKAIGVGHNDNLSVADNLSRLADWSLSVVDSLQLTDSEAKAVATSYAESVSTDDSFVKDIGISKSELVNIITAIKVARIVSRAIIVDEAIKNRSVNDPSDDRLLNDLSDNRIVNDQNDNRSIATDSTSGIMEEDSNQRTVN